MSNITIIEQNFDSGFRGEYRGYHIDTRLIDKPQLFSPIYIKMSNFQSVSSFINIFILAFQFYDCIRYLNNKIEYIYRSKPKAVIPNIYEVNIEKENIIHSMKRITDDLIMVLCIYYDYNNILKDNKIKIASIGELKSTKGAMQLVHQIKSELNYSKFESIFNTINDLHNAYKHSCLLNESRMLFTSEGIALSAYYAKYNKIDKVYFLNHNFMHVIIGFSDFLLEFFDVEVCQRIHLINENTYTHSNVPV